MMDYEKLLAEAKKKIDRRMEKNPPESEFYEDCGTYDKNEYEPQALDMSSVNWTRSFLNGAVAYLYFHYKEEKYLDYLKKTVPVHRDYIYSKLKEAHHDDGFRMSLTLVALYKLTGDEEIKRLALTAADQLVKRFVPKVGIIAGFGAAYGADRTQTIIDDMMNIALLMWAEKETGNSFYRCVYTSHIKTILRDVKRDDNSFRHSFLWDAKTGEPLSELNYCGYSVGSIWSRGQSWVLYGLINALDITCDETLYVPQINGLLDMLLSHLKEYPVPKWDLNMLGNDTSLWDSSAAAIIVSALLKLKEIPIRSSWNGLSINYSEKIEEIMECLIEDFWAKPEKDNILEGGQYGNQMCGCVWGDYFMVEALVRKLHGAETPDFWV